MTQFKFKNLPKDFEFPITKHEIREFAKTTAADFEVIEFGGLSSSENKQWSSIFGKSHFVCYLKAAFREDFWRFKLEVKGLRPERYENRRPEIAQALIAEINRWTSEKMSLTTTAPKKPCRAHISFGLTQKSKEIVTLSEWD